MKAPTHSPVDVTPSASRLTNSLRDIGYDFAAALADVIDNSVAAGATEVDVEIVFEGVKSYVLIADNGHGMGEAELHEALRFGTRRDYEWGELGRYGLGLKTASISQCRRVSVVTRRTPRQRRIASLCLDLNHIEKSDRWEVVYPPGDSYAYRSLKWLDTAPGTVVLWEVLDRVLPERNPENGWARRKLESLAVKASDYLGMVFHRFIEGTAGRDLPLTISVNGEKVTPWNPFAPLEEERIVLPTQEFEVAVGELNGLVTLNRYVLPPRDRFSSMAEFDRMSGPSKWNRQQGLYIYRAGRLIQHGGWSGIRAVDEHTKFARAALDFQTDLDVLFQINVAKMRVALPPEIKTLVERPIHELCHRADAVYRKDAAKQDETHSIVDLRPATTQAEVGAALIAAALDSGEQEAFMRIMENLRSQNPTAAELLGW